MKKRRILRILGYSFYCLSRINTKIIIAYLYIIRNKVLMRLSFLAVMVMYGVLIKGLELGKIILR